MKKVLSVILAALMLISVCGVLAYAADDNAPTRSYTVTLDSDTAQRMSIISVKYPLEKDEDGNYVTASPYVAEGGDFHFIIVPKGSYRFDQTTTVKIFPETFYTDLLNGKDYTTAQTPDGSTEYIWDYIYQPDADGVYTISGVTEDQVIKVYNLQEDSLSDIKDFLMNFAKFFRDLITWFFGLF